MEWIDVKDKLPETGDLVVGFHSSQLVPVVCFLSQKKPYYIWDLVTCCFYTSDMDTIKTVSGKITHWMQLPKIKEILDTIKFVKLCLMAHPDNEEGSEFADRIDDLVGIEVKLDRLDSCELHKFLDDNIEESKIKCDNGYNPLFMAGWASALMHVKVNYLQQLNDK